MTRIHLIGIGGSGLSAIARILLESGYSVSGSDRQPSSVLEGLEQLGARVFAGHRAEYVEGADLVIRSSAIPDNHVEVQAAISAGIPVMKRADFLGSLMEGRLGIAVAGTHGKTTTTAMIAWTLSALGQDPSYIIGSVSKNLGANAHAGRGRHFVIEADEYDRMFLGLKPDIAVVTNVEHDHPDFYPTPRDFRQAFRDFARLLPEHGKLIACGDDEGACDLLNDAMQRGQRGFSYGIGPHNHYRGQALEARPGRGYSFDFYRGREEMGVGNLQVPGEHNVRNALAALAVVDVLGLPLQPALKALGEFNGTSRRFEVRGEVGGVTVIDDYAHHPSEIRATLSAARARYPGHELWVVWQPHTYSRVQTLLEGFSTAFESSDHVLVTEVYGAREEPPAGFSTKRIAESIKGPPVKVIPELKQASQYLMEALRPGDILLVLSAGDANWISSQVLSELKEKNHTSRQVLQPLFDKFGERLLTTASLSRYTSARVGGPADFLLEVKDQVELVESVGLLWRLDVPFIILGGGSNVLIADAGVRGVVIINRARHVRLDENGDPPTIWAESGANLGFLARHSAAKGFSGLEWAAGIPGTVGGAVVGNAGAHGGDISQRLLVAEILQHSRKVQSKVITEEWPVERLEYSYRNSLLKQKLQGRTTGLAQPEVVVLSATFKLDRSNAQSAQKMVEDFTEYRKNTQPPGASMGSMFKNPAGDYAGRLIEGAGLKGLRVGNAEISNLHANFFINLGEAKARDVRALIETASEAVKSKYGIDLELEIELIGDWDER